MKTFTIYNKNPRIVKNAFGEDVRVHTYQRRIEADSYKAADRVARENHACHSYDSSYENPCKSIRYDRS